MEQGTVSDAAVTTIFEVQGIRFTWVGDWMTVACSKRARKNSAFFTEMKVVVCLSYTQLVIMLLILLLESKF